MHIIGWVERDTVRNSAQASIEKKNKDEEKKELKIQQQNGVLLFWKLHEGMGNIKLGLKGLNMEDCFRIRLLHFYTPFNEHFMLIKRETCFTAI